MLHVTQEVMGQQQVQDFGITTYLTVTVAPDTGSRLKMAIAVDSMVPDPGTSIPGTDWLSARGVALRGALWPTGQITDIVSHDSAASPFVRQLLAGFRDFFPRLPMGGLSPTASWVDTVETKIPTGGGELTIKTTNTNHTTDWLQHVGTRALEIQTSSRYTLTGTGQQAGQDLTFDGSGVQQASTYVSLDGRFLGGTSTDSSSINVFVSAVGVVVPVVRISKNTLSVLP